MYDGAELFKNIRKADRKLFEFEEHKYLISLVNYTYPKGVFSEKSKNKVNLSEHEVLTFMKADKFDTIDIHFRFGKRFKEYLTRFAKKASSISNLEQQVYRTDVATFKKSFNNQLVPYDMMQFVLDTLMVLP